VESRAVDDRRGEIIPEGQWWSSEGRQEV